MTATYAIGDVFDRLAEVPDGSVDLIVTSPPYLALRSYLPADHPNKSREIGSEATPAEFIDTLLRVTAELRRVLAPHGSLCVELGDTYAGSGGAGGDYSGNGWRDGQERFGGSGRLARYSDQRGNPDGMRDTTFSGANTRSGGGPGWPLAKSKTLIPELYRIALAYGRNPLRSPLTARELVDWFERIVADMSASGNEPPATDLLRMMSDYTDQWAEVGPYREYGTWRVRNVVTWVRPNPPVGALGDKWRPATSDVVVACTSDRRYWDDLATRRPFEDIKDQRHRSTNGPKQGANPAEVLTANYSQRVPGNPKGAPLLDWWEIPPGGYSGSHYAVFPEALVEPLVKAMAPPRVCVTCGEPSRRIVETANAVGKALRWEAHTAKANDTSGSGRTDILDINHYAPDVSQKVTLGWTDCGHDNWRSAHILDPFAGSGTTLAVATGHGLDALGFDLDERNADLALERVGPLMLTVVEKGSPLP
jgi:DNA modification methylase